MTEPRPKDVAAFVRAARENNVEKLKEYLASGMAVDVRDPHDAAHAYRLQK